MRGARSNPPDVHKSRLIRDEPNPPKFGTDRGGMIGSSHDVPLVYTAVTLLEFIKSAFN